METDLYWQFIMYYLWLDIFYKNLRLQTSANN